MKKEFMLVQTVGVNTQSEKELETARLNIYVNFGYNPGFKK